MGRDCVVFIFRTKVRRSMMRRSAKAKDYMIFAWDILGVQESSEWAQRSTAGMFTQKKNQYSFDAISCNRNLVYLRVHSPTKNTCILFCFLARFKLNVPSSQYLFKAMSSPSSRLATWQEETELTHVKEIESSWSKAFDSHRFGSGTDRTL